ncbi:phosphoribosylglycinamide formyltransferase [Arenicella chitinivorans]|uniref:Phosphoribosylglycinamide formyltransferase n=1 Tax=Arenicella chitinivorans TaxID=1329800 RepID=A0A918VHV3_9GAMM|nr:phosphoribosylglycinamide formyltransferase [Arenicella chitinivorans]GGZ98879.1 phosphoribosylglycinamide formyltransferase [Arenicella chitinivorans]
MINTPARCKAVVLISGGGSNLQAFIDQIEAGQLPLDIALVISNKPEAFGLERATRAGIDTLVVNHKAYPSRDDFDRALQRAIDAATPDLVILAGFMRILTADFVNHFRHRLINIHPSLLPKYPGTNTHQRALDAGDTWHGASIHFVVPEVDAGPIILQGRLKIRSDDNADQLQQRIHKIEHQLYPLAARWFAEQRLSQHNGKVLLDGETSDQQLQTFDL